MNHGWRPATALEKKTGSCSLAPSESHGGQPCEGAIVAINDLSHGFLCAGHTTLSMFGDVVAVSVRNGVSIQTTSLTEEGLTIFVSFGANYS